MRYYYKKDLLRIFVPNEINSLQESDFILSELSEVLPILNHKFNYDMYHLLKEDVSEYIHKTIHEKLNGEEMLILDEMDMEKKGEEVAYKVLNNQELSNEHKLKVAAFRNLELYKAKNKRVS